jgi:hypothetical protein
MGVIEKISVSSIEEYVKIVGEFVSGHKSKNSVFYFRGEKDYGEENALIPFIYRKGLYENEHKLYREISRFNDKDFEKDKTAIDRLCRMQHFGCPTRMLDLGEDCFTALYFALEDRDKEPNKPSFVYLFSIPEDKIKFYDSDRVTILANLAKLPFSNEAKLGGDNSKEGLVKNAEHIISKGMSREDYNEEYFKYLHHEIREDKPYMLPAINLGDIFSVLCVKTKLNNDRIMMQKGAFLLFGLNANDAAKAIPLDGSYGKPNYWQDREDIKWVGTPIEKILRISLEKEISLENLENLGISKPYIYPNMEKIAEHFTKKFEHKRINH